jgi:hypothetical protein
MRARRRTWLRARPAIIVIALAGGCDGDASDGRPDATTPSPRESPASREPRDGSAPAARDGAPSSDSGDAQRDAGTTRCPATPIPEGELQNQASGSSVFGHVVGGEVGHFDALGNTECGVEGVRVCLLDTETCTDSDAAGQFVLIGLPEEADAAISFEKTGFGSALRLVQLQAAPVNLRRTRVLRRTAQRSLLETIGESPDASRGTLVAVPVAAGEGIGTVIIPAGVSIVLMPGDRAPVYSRGAPESGGPSSDEIDLDLSATGFGGWALFAAVEPGDYTVRFERDGAVCDQSLPGSSHGVDDSGHLKVKVVAGFVTSSVAAFCP